MSFCREENKDQLENEEEANGDEKRVISYEVITFLYSLCEETINKFMNTQNNVQMIFFFNNYKII